MSNTNPHRPHATANTSLLERLQRYTTSLGYAIFDRKLEMRGERVVYYYDADVIYAMILGFEADLPGRKSIQTEKQKLVRALLSCHRLGTIHMLRPHTLELDNKLRNQPKPNRKEEWAAFRAKAQEYLKDKKINTVLERLHRILSEESGLGDEEKVEEFLDVLRQEGAETFTAIEQIYGTWTTRFRRYYDQGYLRFDHPGPNVQDLMGTDRELVFQILKIIKEYRPSRRVANFHDSMALAILHQKLREKAKDPQAEVARFYSHSRTLNKACWKDPALRDLLSHHAPLTSDDGVPSSFRSSVRDDDYFLMRLKFEELEFEHEGKNSTELKEIEDHYSEIQQLVDQQTEVSEDALKGIHLRDKPLLEVLDEFEALALMDSIWVRHRLPPDLERNFSQWTDVFHFVQSGDISESLDEKITDIQKELSSKVSQMRRWTEDFKLLQDGGRNTRKKIGDIRKELENPMRDLGLVRWGYYSFSEKSREDLVEDVKTLIQAGKGEDDQEELDDTCSQLASRMDVARSDIDECLYMSAILWAIGKFDSLVRLVEACEGAVGELPPTLVVLSAAAQLKAPDSGTPKTKQERFAEKRHLVDRVWNLSGALPEEQRGGYLLGVGYVLYHAWKSESPDLELRNRDNDNEIREWAQKCYEAGREALGELGTRTLAWAFAVNHCAYVGLVTEVGSEEEREVYRLELVKLKGEPVWNSRFADTLGCYYLIPMEREWRETPAEERSKLDFDNRILRADEYFQNAKEIDFGDIDLESHIQRLKHLRDNYESARNRGSTRS